MLRNGDTYVHFTKLKSIQLAEMRSILERRPKQKFSMGLSPEAQEAMQQAAEDARIQQNEKRGKRGSKANVLFSDTVQIRHENTPAPGSHGRRMSFTDVFEEGHPNFHGSVIDGDEPISPRRSRGRRRSSVSNWIKDRRGSTTSLSTSLEEVELANRNMASGTAQEVEKGGARGITEDVSTPRRLSVEKCLDWVEKSGQGQT